MTCKPNWPEIKANLRRGEQASDRQDIIARVFMQKLKVLNEDLDQGVRGVVVDKVHAVKYQKRDLPHDCIHLIMRPEDKSVLMEDVDSLKSPVLPDKVKHPELYETAVSNMLHGTCEQQNPNCPCMKNGKHFSEKAVMAKDKYPTYMRRPRSEGHLIHKGKCGIMPR
ncbi:Helitron helicase [Phytophthora megakarya]|uniref:Helitron helicase n=1 Tax=Phytophthora megakarya TaxID=4795 RepID=A0A225X2R2_9STRA|nr:Helitron helicase [Phytophthora megakarya]